MVRVSLHNHPLTALPDRVWKLPRHKDDEAAEEGIGRILALSDGVFAIGAIDQDLLRP